jgi:hypothetical protein
MRRPRPSRPRCRLAGLTIILAGLAALAGVAQPTSASTIRQKGIVTPIELKTCKRMGKPADGARWLCPGITGFPVFVAEDDLRVFVSVGTKPEARAAASQTLGAFNDIFRGKQARAMLEWRTGGGGADGTPRAVIIKYYTNLEGRRGEVVVVVKVNEREACHAAYFDALANAEAISMARQWADDEAPKFTCGGKPLVIGPAGVSPM